MIIIKAVRVKRTSLDICLWRQAGVKAGQGVENKMKTQDYLEFDIFVNCHFCLTKQEVVTNLCGKAEGSQQLLRIYSNLIKFEFSINYDFPFNICNLCEEKLQSSFNFLEQCRHSHNLIQQFFPKSAEQHSEENSPSSVEIKEDEDVEYLPSNIETEVTEDVEYSESNIEMKFEEDVEYSINNIEMKVKEDIEEVEENVKDKGKQRLEQFPVEAVEEEIQQADAQLSKIECFNAVNTKTLRVHILNIHNDLKESWCPQCNQVFDNLTEHSKEHAEITCKFCPKVFHSKCDLKEHLQSHSGIRAYNCNTCEKSFKTSRSLRAHSRKHANEKPKERKKKKKACPICGMAFVQYTLLNLHIKRHRKTKPGHGIVSEVEAIKDSLMKVKPKPQISSFSIGKHNFCNICNKRVKNLTTHNDKKHGEGNGEENLKKLCPVCGKRYKLNRSLKVHMRLHTGEFPYKCHYCEKRYPTSYQLVVHERIHTGEKPYVCSDCGKGFRQWCTLKTHKKRHADPKEVCTICDRKFYLRGELRIHVRIHTGEKPYHCTTCSRSFSSRGALVAHVKIHSDERPYKCSYCDWSFKQKCARRKHEEIHSTKKPYQCSQCPYVCRQGHTLTKHMEQHVLDFPRMDRPHTCSKCSRTFTTNAMLNSHRLKVHMDDKN